MQLIRRHPVGSFIALSYALTLVVFAVPLLAVEGLGVLPIELGGLELFLVAAALGMAALAFAVSRIAGGREATADLGRRTLRFRVSPIWWLAAIVLLPAAAFATAVALAGTAPLSAISADPSLVVTWLLGMVLAVVLVNFWEELAWTGFVLDRLQRRFGPLRAAVVTAWAHAGWHVPLLFIVGGVSDVRIAAEQYPIYLGILFVLPIPVRIVLTWLYNRSGRSIPVAALYHSAMGVATGGAFMAAIAPGVDSVWVYAGFTVLAVAVVVLTRGRLGYDADIRERAVTSTPSRAASPAG